MKFIGVISGTSMDGIDVALVEIEERGDGSESIKPISFKTYPYKEGLRKRLRKIHERRVKVEEIISLDYEVGEAFSDAVKKFVEDENVNIKGVVAIGSHGQTVFHKGRLTLQLGDGAILAQRIGKDIICDFRRADIASGGCGAPLAPILHYSLFKSDEKSRVILNIGGIANLTYLPKGCSFSQVLGFDTGPGNVLLDELVKMFTKGKKSYDEGGKLASRGRVIGSVLEKFLKDSFIQMPPPKSAGNEFSGSFLRDFLKECEKEGGEGKVKKEDILATASALTAYSIKENMKFLGNFDEVILCGGGSKNNFLVEMIKDVLKVPIYLSDEFGINSDSLEAILFAYLAYLFVRRKNRVLTNITGSYGKIILGKLVPGKAVW